MALERPEDLGDSGQASQLFEINKILWDEMNLQICIKFGSVWTRFTCQSLRRVCQSVHRGKRGFVYVASPPRHLDVLRTHHSLFILSSCLSVCLSIFSVYLSTVCLFFMLCHLLSVYNTTYILLHPYNKSIGQHTECQPNFS